MLTLEGQAEPGQKIEILVDGKKIGDSVRADADGRFTFFQPFNSPQRSAVQGEAIVSLENDPALRAAFNEVLEVSAQAQQ